MLTTIIINLYFNNLCVKINTEITIIHSIPSFHSTLPTLTLCVCVCVCVKKC